MIQTFKTMVTPFGKERNVYVHLPENYYETEERYPVMYMYDGHNLFEDRTATYGKSWGLEEFLNSYDKPMIVVGVECSKTDRLSEYCPYSLNAFGQELTGKGGAYMDWLVYEFKPMIDAKYRTIPFRECTGIAGSSMGGLMSYYTIYKYNLYFSKAACLSPSLMICKKELDEEFADLKISQDTRVYLSMGTKEYRGAKQAMEVYADELKQRRAFSYGDIIDGGMHNEATWETCNQTYYDFLWK